MGLSKARSGYSAPVSKTSKLECKAKGMLVEKFEFDYMDHPTIAPFKDVDYDANNGRLLGFVAGALQVEAPPSSNPCHFTNCTSTKVDAPLSQSMASALQVDAPLTQYMAGAMQVEAPLNSNPRKSMAGALQVDTPLTQSLAGAMQVEAPLNSNPRSMAGALQVEAPLNSSPCHSTNGASMVSERVYGSFRFRNVSRMGNAMQNGGNPSQSEQNGQCKMDMEYGPHGNSETGYNNGNNEKRKSWGETLFPGGSSDLSVNGRDTSEMAAGGGLLGPIEGDKPPAGANTSKEGNILGSGMAGKGYVHHYTDIPTTTNLEMANGPPVKSWKSLVSIPVKSGSPLQFYRPHCANGKLVAKPPTEAVNEGIDMWKGCLVGQFLDKRLPFPVVRSLVNRLWGKREMPDISTTGNGLFFFRFKDPEARDWVMNAGPWHLAGRPFILRAWKPGMDMLNIQLSSIPIWVRFYNIPLEYWTSTCLGHITSTVGIPLHLDPLTENQTKLSFARICVEVGVDCEFPTSVLLDRGNGNYSTIKIEYPWAPQCCTECKLFGYNLVNCPVKKGPSNGQVSTISRNSKHEDVIRKDNHDAGEGLKLAADTSSVDRFAINPTVTQTEVGVRMDVEETKLTSEDNDPPKLHGNTFACLAQSEEADPSEEEGPLNEPNPNTNFPGNTIECLAQREEEGSTDVVKNLDVSADFSDTSPTLHTFKHEKRIDELDFTPVPLSKKKLKKLKKQSQIAKQASDRGGSNLMSNG